MTASVAPIRVVVAEDELVARTGLARLLQDAGFAVVGLAPDGPTLLSLVAYTRPDIAIVDVRMPSSHPTAGLQAAWRIRRQHPGTAVLLLSKHIETYHVAELLKNRTAGAGYLLKDRIEDLPTFMAAVRRVATGGEAIDPEVTARVLSRRRLRSDLDRLTDAERRVLCEMAEGYANRVIAERLHVDIRTIEAHIAIIFQKLQVPGLQEVDRRAYAILTYLRGA